MEKSDLRYNWVDRTKGLAILLVVMGHLYFFSYEKSESVVFLFIYSFHMPLFMFLSGFLVPKNSSIPLWNYNVLIKKVVRLLLPMFWFGCLFTLSFSHIESISSFFSVFLNFMNSPNKNGYWYLMSLSVYYISLLFYKLNTQKKLIIDITIAILTLGSFFVGWKFLAQNKDPFCLLNCANFYFFFMLGVFSRKYGFVDFVCSHNWLFSISVILYTLLFYLNIQIDFMNSFMYHIAIPFCAIIVVVFLFANRENRDGIVERLLSFFGKKTLDIYVLHYFVVANIHLSIMDRWLETSGNIFLSILATCLLSVIVVFGSIFLSKILHSSNLLNTLVFGNLSK